MAVTVVTSTYTNGKPASADTFTNAVKFHSRADGSLDVMDAGGRGIAAYAAGAWKNAYTQDPERLTDESDGGFVA